MIILFIIVFCVSWVLSYFRLFLACHISYIIICVSVSTNFLFLGFRLFELNVSICACGVCVFLLVYCKSVGSISICLLSYYR